MKKLSKIFLNKSLWIVIAVFLAAFLVRFYNFDQRVVYGPEQGISLISAAENLRKFSLLGIPYLLRQTSTGLNLFTSPVFGYTLIPFILLFKYDVFKITAVFALTNLLTGLALFFIVKRIWNEKTAIFTTILFLFSDYMIYHSLFIWTSNYMPAIGVGTVYLLYRYIKNPKRNYLWIFLLGIVSGLGFGIQYIYLFGIAAIMVYILWKSKRKITDLILFIFGLGVGELPTLIFDIKHDFYHIKTLFAYFLDTLKHPGQSQISYYHFLVLWPAAAILLGILLTKVYGKNKPVSFLLVLVFIFINLMSPRISFDHAIGMPTGLTAIDVLKASKIIDQAASANFNVTVLMNFDNRGYVLRYPLQYIYHKEVLPVEQYPGADSIYVLSANTYDFSKPDIWEIRSFQPYKLLKVQDVNTNYAVYKLTRW